MNSATPLQRVSDGLSSRGLGLSFEVEFSFGASAINVHENQRQYLLV